MFLSNLKIVNRQIRDFKIVPGFRRAKSQPRLTFGFAWLTNSSDFSRPNNSQF